MAFRIHESVVRGEIDNRVKGVVRGKIWVMGRAEPVLLELTGNACSDLAGCLLTFSNPLPPVAHPHLASLAAGQRGTIGDLTASRKVRVFDVPMPEAYLMCKRGEKPAEHWANCLYLEWFSEHNGRVVIESADYHLEISAPEWRLTPEEDAARTLAAAQGMDGFVQKLTEAIEQQQEGQKDPEAEWDEHDYEKFLKESDARTDKYLELLDKYGDSEAAEAEIAREMGWEMEADDEADKAMELPDEIEAAPDPEPDPLREGIDWIRTPKGDIRHPLQHRCYESALKFSREVEALNLEGAEDPGLVQFISGFLTAGAKLAGALEGIAEHRHTMEPAFVVACLKRALDHIHQAQAGLEAVAPRRLLPESLLLAARQELFGIREGILKLMNTYRGQA